MDHRGDPPRLLRGLVTAGLCTLLIAVGHVVGGGALPDLTVLVVLFPLLTGAVVGLADRCRSTAGMLATLGGGQYALHVLLVLLHPHSSAVGRSATTMFLLHAVVTVVIAVLLRRADDAVAAVGAALRRVLPRRPFVPTADAPLAAWNPGDPAPRIRLALAAVPARRGPPVGCRPAPVPPRRAPARPRNRRNPCPVPPTAAAR